MRPCCLSQSIFITFTRIVTAANAYSGASSLLNLAVVLTQVAVRCCCGWLEVTNSSFICLSMICIKFSSLELSFPSIGNRKLRSAGA